jgi:hypothetical protein
VRYRRCSGLGVGGTEVASAASLVCFEITVLKCKITKLPGFNLFFRLCRSGGESSDGRGGHAVMDLTAWNAWGRRSAAGARKGPMLPAVPVGAPSLASKGGWAGSFPPPHSCYPHMQPVYRRSVPPVSRGGAGGSPGGATPPIGRKTGRYPTRTRKDGGRGSSSPLTRAFAGSKLLRDQPLCPPLGILY